MITEKGTLRYGVEFPAGSGQMHYEFELRLPTVGDNVAVLEEHGGESNLRLNVALMARTMTRLGTVPQSDINYELLAGNVIDEDYDVLAEVRDALKKKRTAPKNDSVISTQPSSPLVNTDFQNNKSVS